MLRVGKHRHVHTDDYADVMRCSMNRHSFAHYKAYFQIFNRQEVERSETGKHNLAENLTTLMPFPN
jgi:hypothetical protein